MLPSIQDAGSCSSPGVAAQAPETTNGTNGPKQPALEESLLQAQIECLYEDVISKRIANRRARLALALEAEQATDTFGRGNSDEVIQVGRESLRQACLPPEKATVKRQPHIMYERWGGASNRLRIVEVFPNMCQECLLPGQQSPCPAELDGTDRERGLATNAATSQCL